MAVQAGDDEANGGFGDDIVTGGAGDDILSGGFGGDQMTGGAGQGHSKNAPVTALMSLFRSSR